VRCCFEDLIAPWVESGEIVSRLLDMWVCCSWISGYVSNDGFHSSKMVGRKERQKVRVFLGGVGYTVALRFHDTRWSSTLRL